MAPAVIMALASAVQAVAPLVKSGIQQHRLKKLGDIERPDFQIPEAAQEQLGLARSIASNRNMPGYDEALDKIENQTNRAIGDVKASGGNMQDVMAAMAAANMQASMQKRDLDIMNDKSYLGTLQNLQGQLGQFANWQNAQQQDQMKAYNDEMARRAALDTARQQNMQNGIGAIGQGIAQYGGYQMNMNLMDKMYSGNTKPPVPPAPPTSMNITPLQQNVLAAPDNNVALNTPINVTPNQFGQPITSSLNNNQSIVNLLSSLGIAPGTYNQADVMNRLQMLQG